MQLQYEEVLAGVRDKASLASQQLHTAAHKADLQIRSLATPVASQCLINKLISNILVIITHTIIIMLYNRFFAASQIFTNLANI